MATKVNEDGKAVIENMLESAAGNEEFLLKLRTISAGHLTNQVVCIIMKRANTKKRKNGPSWRQIKECIGNVMNDPLDGLTEQNLRTSMTSVKTRVADLKKYKDDVHIQDLNLYLNSHYKLPGFQGPREVTVTGTSCKPTKTNSFDDEIRALVNTQLLTKSEELVTENKSLKVQVKKSNRILRAIANQDRKRALHSRTIQKHNTTISNLKRSRETWKKCYLQSQERVTHVLSEKAVLLKDIEKLKKQNLKLNKAKRRKNKTTNILKDDQLLEVLRKKERTIIDLKCEISNLQNNILKLEEELAENSQPMTTKTDGRGRAFNSKIREASYYAQNLGIAEDKASELVKSIYESISGQELVGDLPSRKTQSNFGREMKTLSQQQVRDAVANSSDCTIKYDGTTKVGKHITEVEVATKKQTFIIGMKEQSGGCASEYAETIQMCMDDITKKSIDSDEPDISMNISNTMTDRVVTNACVDRLLETDVLGNKVNSFRCAIHPLDTIAKDSEKRIIEAEKDMVPLPPNVILFKRRGESDTQALIKNTGKLFYNDATGCCNDLTAYIKENLALPEGESRDLIQSKLYHRFVGNRFHIYFLDAGLVDYYTGCFLEFFEKVHVPTNAMQKTLYDILKSKCRATTFRALGFVGKFITGPWMRFVPTCEQILDVNLPIQKAVETLSDWSSDASPVMNGTVGAVFDSVSLLKDSVYHHLLKSRGETEDNKCRQLLQDLFITIKAVIVRQMSDQLPGGKFWDPSPELRIQASSCAPDNLSGERCFGTADAYIQRSHNASTNKVEARVMFHKNHTDVWLKEQSPEGRKLKITEVMSETRKRRKVEMERKAVLVEKHKDKMKAARRQLSEKEERTRNQMETLFETILECGGLWTNTDQMEREYKNVRTKVKKTGAVKAQLNFRYKYLNPGKIPISLTKCTDDELKSHLESLFDIPAENIELKNIIQNFNSIVGLRFYQKWESDSGVTNHQGMMIEIIDSEKEKEVKTRYSGDDQDYFMTHSEVIVDVIRGDMQIVWCD